METAADFKAKGNEALVAKKFSEAIENYTKAINLDGTNHVYYSNRSAAYLSKGEANNALDDADACIGLNPTFAKGYSRKGAALHALKRYNDSIASFEEGLKQFPDDSGLKRGLVSVKTEKEGPKYGASPSVNNMFGPDMFARIALDPKLRGYMSDPDFMDKLRKLQNDPNCIGTMLGDPRLMEVFQFLLGGQGMQMKRPKKNEEANKTEAGSTPSAAPTPAPAPKPAPAAAAAPEPTPMETDDDTSKEIKASIAAKEKGNNLYKSKKFEEALAAYDEAIALDPTNMTFVSNKAAVYFTTKKYDECIAVCNEAVEVGQANRAPFEDRAKALTRCAKAYQKKKDLAMAIEMCKKAQLESYDKATERMMKTMELEKRKSDALAYQDDEKADEAKQEGNTHFRNKDFGKAVNAYEEAVKRAPKNATIRNNLAAALCKIMDFNGAKRAIEVALDVDDKYVKAWARKGDIEVLMKENHKAMESYKKGLAIEPDNVTCRDGLRKVTAMVNRGQANVSEEEKKERAAHAMADPEIQAIMSDPIINQILRDFNENPTAANEAMKDATVREKIEKLIASGIVQTS